jgi:hypothetical protein
MKKDIDVTPFMKELFDYHKPWSDTRAKRIPLHRDTLAVHLRTAVVKPGEHKNNAQEDRETSEYSAFPALTSYIETFAKEINGTVARAIIVSLKPSSQVYAHIDEGTYYERRDRYHLVLQSLAGSRMLSGGEECVFQKGELWWFDNKAMHEAFNPSDGAERIHVIFDVLPNR